MIVSAYTSINLLERMQTVRVRLAGPGDRISDSDFGRMAWKGRWRGRRDSEYEGDGTSKHHNFTCNSDKKSYQSLHRDREPESRGRLRPPERQLSLVVPDPGRGPPLSWTLTQRPPLAQAGDSECVAKTCECCEPDDSCFSSCTSSRWLTVTLQQ